MSWRGPVVVFAIATLVKILLIPAYRSTDFEVHRNWLAITHSLPLSKWYYEDSSEWTLDYPPFFAWFEWLLSQVAVIVDPLIVQLESLEYTAHSCVVFQRMSVIASDTILLYGVYQYCCYQESSSTEKSVASRRTLVTSLLLLFNYGLLVVDHIHFQYNGFLFGILILSITRILQCRYLEGAFFFAALLNFKHIFLYISPAFFVYLLRHYCFRTTSTSSPQHTTSGTQREIKKEKEQISSLKSSSSSSILKGFQPMNFVKLGSLVVAIFLVSFGPFIYLGQLRQVVSRLFPFKRGLCHAYWAPNVWALYSLADKILAVIGTNLGMLSRDSLLGSSMTSGLVGEMQFQALPSIPPWLTMALSLLAMMPSLVQLWVKPHSEPLDFVKSVVACAFASFLFGWHVHEKAILMILLPLSLLAVEDAKYTRIYLLLLTAGHVSLFPLLFQPAETYLKLFLFVLCTLTTFMALQTILGRSPRTPDALSPNMPAQTPSDLPSPDSSPTNSLSSLSPPALTPLYQLPWLESLYLVVLALVQVYCLFVHGSFGLLTRFQFLPLLLTSISCAIGVAWTWLLFSWQGFVK